MLQNIFILINRVSRLILKQINHLWKFLQDVDSHIHKYFMVNRKIFSFCLFFTNLYYINKCLNVVLTLIMLYYLWNKVHSFHHIWLLKYYFTYFYQKRAQCSLHLNLFGCETDFFTFLVLSAMLLSDLKMNRFQFFFSMWLLYFLIEEGKFNDIT